MDKSTRLNAYYYGLSILMTCCLLLTFSSAAAGATLGDLAGTWNFSAIATGPDAPWWDRVTMSVESNGTFTYTETESDGTNKEGNGAFSTSSDGFLLNISGGGTSGMLCQIDLGNTLMACTQTWPDGSTDLAVGVRQAASYTAEDGVGDWEDNALDGGPTNPSWMRVTGDTVDIDGNYQGTYSDSNGNTGPLSGQVALSADGETTCISGCPDTNYKTYLDSSKTISVGTYGVTNTNPDGVLTIFTKMAPAGSYSLADLAGVWQLNAVASGPEAPWWDRGTLRVNPDGTWSGTAVYSDGSSGLKTGTFAISSGGLITCTEGCSDPNLRIVMNAGKTVMVGTDTWSGSDSPGTTDIEIFTKSSGGLWQNAKPTGVGWNWLGWFGYFNTSYSPWIYQQTLGWLYPYGTSTDSIWFYDPAMNAFWWTSALVYPYVYRASDNAWLYYLVPAPGKPSTPRWFYDFKAGKWEKD